MLYGQLKRDCGFHLQNAVFIVCDLLPRLANLQDEEVWQEWSSWGGLLDYHILWSCQIFILISWAYLIWYPLYFNIPLSLLKKYYEWQDTHLRCSLLRSNAPASPDISRAHLRKKPTSSDVLILKTSNCLSSWHVLQFKAQFSACHLFVKREMKRLEWSFFQQRWSCTVPSMSTNILSHSV